MGDSDDSKFNESDYEVIDECFDEDNDIDSIDMSTNMDSENNLLDDGSKNGEKSINEKNSLNTITVVEIEDDVKNETAELYKSQNDNAIDFTADITLDQLDDNDVMSHLTEIENIVLNSENFGLESDEMNVDESSLVKLSQDNKDIAKSTNQSQDIILIDELHNKNNESEKIKEELWYEEKINFKVKIVTERLSRLAVQIKNSYPCYKNCLDRIQSKIGTPVCKLDPPRKCPLDQVRINRWKFICTKKESVDLRTTGDSKNIKTEWELHLYKGLNTNVNNTFEMIPDFVMKSVKMFKDFINSFDELNVQIKSEPNDDDVILLETNDKSSGSINRPENEFNRDSKPQWLCLLVRSNSKNELMMFATGKFITHSTMESLKQLFESGLGKNCNVKSLYCRTIGKINNVQTSNTTFLVGSEALDETVGELKIQLAPKTNFWLSTAGAEELAKTVQTILDPPELGTVIDIGCGLGLIGLSIARKCYQVIGIDSPSEIEEAEMTCELNKIKNAYFMMGEPGKMMATIKQSVEWRRVYAVINANTNIGCSIEVMTGLRKIKNLRRIVMVTKLTEKSVHSILELTRPADNVLGDPFVVTRAIVIDTLPTGPHFEVVLLMERHPLPQMLDAVLSKALSDFVPHNLPKKSGKNSPKKNNTQKSVVKNSNIVRNMLATRNRRRGLNKKLPLLGNETVLEGKKGKQIEKSNEISNKKLVKNPFYDKPKILSKNKKKNLNRKMSSILMSQINKNPRKLHGASATARKNSVDSSFNEKNEIKNLFLGSPQKSQKRKYEWDLQSNTVNNTFVTQKKLCDIDETKKIPPLMSKKIETDLLQKVQEQQRFLEVAKQKLASSSQVVDNYTAREVHDILNLAIEQTNEIQNQLPRSLWDPIHLPDQNSSKINIQDKMMFKEHHMQEVRHEDVLITTSNQGFKQTFDASWVCNKHSSIPPLEPNIIAPLDKYTTFKPNFNNHKLSNSDDLRQCSEMRWTPPSSSRRSGTPPKHPNLLSSSTRILSPPRNNFPSQQYQQSSSIHLQNIATRREMASISRPFTSLHRSTSPPRPNNLPPINELIPRQMSPPRHSTMSVNFNDEWNVLKSGTSGQKNNYQSTIDNRQSSFTLQRSMGFNVQQEQFQLGTNSNLNWDGKNRGNDNQIINGVGNNITQNNKPMSTIQPANNQWQQQQRFGGLNSGKWNVQSKDSSNTNNNTRNEHWNNVNKQKWNEPQSNKHLWNQSGNKNNWNGITENTRVSRTDNGNTSVQPQQIWNRNDVVSNIWPPNSMSKDNWKRTGTSMINSNQNSNNARWSGGGGGGGRLGNDNTNNQPNMNWQYRNNNNGCREQNSYGGFPPRPFN